MKDDDKWMLGENIPNCDLFFSNIWLEGFVSNFGEYTGRPYKKIACKYEGYNLWFYFGERDSYELGEQIAERIVKDPTYGEEINKNIIIQADRLREFSKTIPQKNLDELFVQDLWEIYKKHLDIHREYYAWSWIPVGADMFHNNLTNRIRKYLLEIGLSENVVNGHMVTITQPTEKSLIFIEQESLLAIAVSIEKDFSVRDIVTQHNADAVYALLPGHIQHLLDQHFQTYYYTKHLWVSGEYTIVDYVNQLKDIFESGISAVDVLDMQKKELDKARQQKEVLLSELNIDVHWRRVLKSYGDFMVTKIYRRYAQLLAVHHMSAIIKEIARRHFITEKQVRFMLEEEVKLLLLEGKCDEATLLTRTKSCVLYAEQGFCKVYVGADAQPFFEAFAQKIDTNIDELRGDIGCSGYAKGKVKIIIRAEEMKKMDIGDILVSIATDPDIVPAMKKAGAIVTEQGGVTSHAAIVSRELGIPCVIGTKIATKVFKDGDEVEVDAVRGIVRKL